MARKLVSKEEAQVERRYESIRILSDGRIRFSTRPGAAPGLEFWVQRHHMEVPDTWVYDSANYDISACRSGRPVLFLYVSRSRVTSACFAFNLSADELREAIPLLRKAGLARWLAPALKRTQNSLTKLGSNDALLKSIPSVLDSLRRRAPARRASRVHAGARRTGRHR